MLSADSFRFRSTFLAPVACVRSNFKFVDMSNALDTQNRTRPFRRPFGIRGLDRRRYVNFARALNHLK